MLERRKHTFKLSGKQLLRHKESKSQTERARITKIIRTKSKLSRLGDMTRRDSSKLESTELHNGIVPRYYI